MRILTRYILREVASHALIGVAIFTFMFTRDLARILELIVRNSAPLPSVAELFFLTLPVAFTYTLPMGVLVGILIGLSRLAADSEVTAMRASGIGVWTFVRIISIFAIGAWLLALVEYRVFRAEIAGCPGPVAGPPESFAGILRGAAESFLRGVSAAGCLCRRAASRGASIWKGCRFPVAAAIRPIRA